MLVHLRVNLLLLSLTFVLCALLYPLALWCVGQTVFSDSAQGSLLADAQGKLIGSRLIAQGFTGDEYFQPRPSAASYNGAASGATNWSGSNYLLRDRVARQLGPIVCYGNGSEKDGKKPGEFVGPDIEKWFQRDRYQDRPGIVAQWAALHGGLAEAWLKDTDNALKPQWKSGDKDRESGQSFLLQLAADDPLLHQELIATLKASASATPADLAQMVFPLFSRRYPGEWLVLEDFETTGNAKRKKLMRVKESNEIRAVFFDMWRQEHPNVSLEEVPADMVMASGSGLDPHITLKNAQYQLTHRIAKVRAKKIVREQALKLRQDFDALDENQRQTLESEACKTVEARVNKLLTDSGSAPLGGFAGVPLINVLEINLALDQLLSPLTENWK